ncbi:alpha/beta hydrolase [Streptomyces sp. LP11]|uniref:Alpha/beta hydrolase n=1 Tax=Streptomyces pyxinicus TaxID=2970331 RepID=A0ABT2AX57_9ACTN|nr:alpha/beta hydrolase [Streptomyces sp. LP11]MCS0600838.1 alpha/beta hydrolase [Streptomyces sp. LP11]
MRTLRVAGAEFDVRDEGDGEPVLLVAGSGAAGRVWDLHQVPALRAAGFRVLTFDRRPLQETSSPPDPRALAAELSHVLAELGLPGCRAVGASFGGEVVQELMLSRPELVTRAVLMATRGRGDLSGRTMADAERELAAAGVRLPPRYAAWQRAVLNLSPATWRREDELLDWLDLFEAAERAGTAPVPVPAGGEPADRLAALGRVSVPVLVLGFEHDLIVPPWLCREVAGALPRGRYAELAECGHYGYLERPAEVNAALLEFLTTAA